MPPQINFRNPPSTNIGEFVNLAICYLFLSTKKFIGTSGNILSKNYYPSSNNNDFSNNNWQNDTLTNNHVNSIAGGDGDLAMLRSANVSFCLKFAFILYLFANFKLYISRNFPT